MRKFAINNKKRKKETNRVKNVKEENKIYNNVNVHKLRMVLAQKGDTDKLSQLYFFKIRKIQAVA